MRPRLVKMFLLAAISVAGYSSVTTTAIPLFSAQPVVTQNGATQNVGANPSATVTRDRKAPPKPSDPSVDQSAKKAARSETARGSLADSASASLTSAKANSLNAKTGPSDLAANSSSKSSNPPSESSNSDETGAARDASSAGSLDSFFQQLFGSVGSLISGARNTRPTETSSELPRAILNKEYCESLVGGSAADSQLKQTGGIVPKGLVFRASDQTLCGIPKETGIFRFQAELTTTDGDLSKYAFRLVVLEKDPDDSDKTFEILTTQLAVGVVGAEYADQLQAQGGKLPLSWEVMQLPQGLEFDQNTGVIGGTPEDPGEFPVTVVLRDAENKTLSRDFILTIRTTPVFIVTGELEEGVINEAYQSRLSAQGGLRPYAWQIIGGTLPEGLLFDGITGTIAGVPTIASRQILRVQVTDSEKKTDAVELPFEVRASALQISTPGLADGMESQDYLAAFAARGGTPPYRWSVGGSLPPALVLDATGHLSGTLLNAAEFRIFITVTDANEQSASKEFPFRVQAAPEPTPTPQATPTPASNATPTPQTTPDGNPGVANPLKPISNLLAVPSDGKVGLLWKFPSDSSFENIFIVRSSEHIPTNPDDGILVYAGRSTNTVDTSVNNNQSYFYAGFASYGSRGYSDASNGAQVTPRKVSVNGKPDPFIDSVVAFQPLDPQCFNCSRMPEVVLGYPQGNGEFQGAKNDVVSLNARLNSDNGRSAPYGGSITVKFTDNIVVNGPGVDFIIFENAFRIFNTDLYWLEPATVEVSVDGIQFYRYPFDFVPHFDSSGALNLYNPFSYAKGFAGVKPVYSDNNTPSPTNAVLAGGDQFDLSALPGVELSWIQYIRITSTGDSWLTDENGDLVRHQNDSPMYGASGKGNSGFDLDAVTAVNF